MALAAGLGTGVYNFLSGRRFWSDSWDQWRLVSADLDHFEAVWRQRPRSPIIACLTTIPSRLPHLDLTFKSLLYQNLGVSKIRLHLPPYSQREQCCYVPLEHWKGREWLEIVTCQDWGPATKLIPALQDLPPEQPLLVVDDDMLYPPTLVENLWARKGVDALVASSGWRVPPDLVDRPSTLWDNLLSRPPFPLKGTRVQRPQWVDIVQGYSGFLSCPAHYDVEAVCDYSSAPEAVRWVDDVWLSAHCRVPKWVVPAPRYCFERWKGRAMMKAGSLGRINRGGGDPLRRNNTLAIRYLQDRWELNRGKRSCDKGPLPDVRGPV